MVLLINGPFPIPIVNSKLWKIMQSNQRKGTVELASLQKSLVKFVARTLNKFTEAQKKCLKYN